MPPGAMGKGAHATPCPLIWSLQLVKAAGKKHVPTRYVKNYTSKQWLCRLHLCQTGSGSAGTREFVKKMYANIKLANPGFPFLIREAEGTPAQITGRYGAHELALARMWLCCD